MNLDDPRVVRRLRRAAIALLAILALLDLVVHHHAHFAGQGIRVDPWPFFYPVYGFLACVAMVWAAKRLVGGLLKRKDTYYDEP